MKVSDFGKGMIQGFEGLRLKAYTDTAGVRTIGYGHAYWAGADTITKSEAMALFEADIKKFEAHVNTYDPHYGFTQCEFDALVSFAYNVGSIRQLTGNGKRDRGTIAKKMLEYVKSGGVRLEGLAERRKKEQSLFLGKLNTGSVMKPSYCETVRKVMKGEYGNGEERRKNLKADGYDPELVQRCVNFWLKKGC